MGRLPVRFFSCMSGPSRPQPRWSRFHPQGANLQLRIDPTHAGSAREEETADSPVAGQSDVPAAELAETGELSPVEASTTEAAAEGANVAASNASPEELPRGFQLRHVYTDATPIRSKPGVFFLTLGGFLLLGVGGAVGYFAGSSQTAPPQGVNFRVQPVDGLTLALSAKTQSAVDDAFQATKEHRYQDAQAKFDALYKAHPEWPSMAIENARAALYDKNGAATVRTVTELMRVDSVPDADFLLALVYLVHKEYAVAEQHFATAVAIDPARADLYYFWGECLRTEGKPREAVEKFQSALLRNQYETAENLYQLKLWLSQIQSDQEETSGANAKINAALATTPRPPYGAVFAAAARAMKIGGYKEAAEWIAKGQQTVEPVVFRVILQDPTFLQESWRPELKNFYKP